MKQRINSKWWKPLVLTLYHSFVLKTDFISKDLLNSNLQNLEMNWNNKEMCALVALHSLLSNS